LTADPYRFLRALREKLAQIPSQPLADAQARPAAVLLPLYLQADEWHLLFTRRTDTVESHQGQVSFPGGVMENSDASPQEAALRETEEEIGLPAGSVQVLGCLEPTLTVTQYMVVPVVGHIPWPVPLRLNKREVARTFGVPLRWLADPSNLEKHFRLPKPFGAPEPVYFFRPYDGEVIWGATARITLRFLQLAGLRPADD
jgi:8-oxo-dGTP pyrophosphatase MutT (NUDIX family)